MAPSSRRSPARSSADTLMRHTVIVTALLVALVGLRPAPMKSQAALTAQDYFEIHNLIAGYAHGFDSGARAGTMWADAFTDDGVFADGSGREWRGREAIAQFGSGGANSRKSPTSVGHFITNIVVVPTATGARASSYVMIGGGAPRGGGPGRQGGAQPAPGAVATGPVVAFGMGGQYWDDLVRTPSGWRIRARALVRPGTTTAIPSATGPVPPLSAPTPAPTLAADDYRDLLALESLRDHVIANAHIIPVAGGVVVKTYRMNVDARETGIGIGPGGIHFTYVARTPQGWRAQQTFFLTPGEAVPEAAAGFVAHPPTVTGQGTLSVPPPTMVGAGAVSGADLAEIRQLYARAATAFDSGADNGDAYARLFTPTATVQDVPGDRLSGRAALAVAARGNGMKTVTDTHRFVYNVRVARTADGATGQAYVIVATLGGQGRPTTVETAGMYQDALVRTPDGWRFASRQFTSGIR